MTSTRRPAYVQSIRPGDVVAGRLGASHPVAGVESDDARGYVFLTYVDGVRESYSIGERVELRVDAR